MNNEFTRTGVSLRMGDQANGLGYNKDFALLVKVFPTQKRSVALLHETTARISVMQSYKSYIHTVPS